METIWVCLKIVSTPKPNGFADHYPYEKWLFHWEYTLFSDKPICWKTHNIDEIHFFKIASILPSPVLALENSFTKSCI